MRRGNARLEDLLERELVATHPFVIGELACGSIRNRRRLMADLAMLPAIAQAEHEEVLRLTEERKLWNAGVGWIDAHLLAAATLARCKLWTLDKALARVAGTLAVR